MPNASHILVVDDHEPIRRGLAELLKMAGYRVSAANNGNDALRMISEDLPDCVLVDMVMPGGPSGLDVCEHVKRNPRTRLTPVVLISGDDDRETRIAGLEAGADDFLNKPVDTDELYARLQSLLRLKALTDDLESAAAVFMSMACVIEARDPSTNGHCHRLARYAVGLGSKCGLSSSELDALYRGAILHDIGKIAIPDRVLLKRGRLTAKEHDLMKRHTVIGDELCGTIRSLAAVRPIVRHHHERMDGQGYPDGLAGEDIPLLARIVSVVDVFDALTTDRPYRKALTASDAYEILLVEARGGACDAELVATFIDLHQSESLPVDDDSNRQATAGPSRSPMNRRRTVRRVGAPPS